MIPPPYTQGIRLTSNRLILRRRATALLATAAVLPLLLGCGRSAPNPGALMLSAKQTLDGTRAVHFRLTSADTLGAGTLITGGEGDAKRPAEFAGTLQVSFEGLPLSVSVVSAGHVFFVKLPLSSKFEAADPTKYAFNDPAVFLDPNRGLSTMLSQARSAVLADPDRSEGEELEEVHARIPGDLVAGLLTSADTASPKQDVPVTLGINTAKHELRRVVLTGLFFDPKKTSTYTLILDRYGEDVTITRPN